MCHMISAKSFDKLCYDMKQKKDDMSADLYPHGAREVPRRPPLGRQPRVVSLHALRCSQVSSDHLVANNQETRRHARD